MAMPASPAYEFYQWFWTGLDWLYPPHCGGCGQRGYRWCAECQRSTQVISPPVCEICGQSQSDAGLCRHCQVSAPAYSALRSWGVFNGSLRQALHRLKYKRDVALGECLARPLMVLLRQQRWKIDLVAPVPISVARRAERGYNQATYLALPLALALRLSFSEKALCKVRETPTQVGLSVEQRWANVAHAFTALPGMVDRKNVLIVDDVTTSGATLDACASALLEAGAAHVYGLTLARAQRNSD